MDLSGLDRWFLRLRIIPTAANGSTSGAEVRLFAVRASSDFGDGPQRDDRGISGSALEIDLIQSYLLPSRVRANRLAVSGDTAFLSGQDTARTNQLFSIDLTDGFRSRDGGFALRTSSIIVSRSFQDDAGVERPVSDLDTINTLLVALEAFSGRLELRTQTDLLPLASGPELDVLSVNHRPGLIATDGASIWVLEIGLEDRNTVARIVRFTADRFERVGSFVAPNALRGDREFAGLAFDGRFLWVAERDTQSDGPGRLLAISPAVAMAAGFADAAIAATFDLDDPGFPAGALSFDAGSFYMLVGDRRIAQFTLNPVAPPAVSAPGRATGVILGPEGPADFAEIAALAPVLGVTVNPETITSPAPVRIVFTIDLPSAQTRIIDDRLLLEGAALPLSFAEFFKPDASGRRVTITLDNVTFPPGTSATFTYVVVTTDGIATADIIVDIPPS